jgi:hypothetical protein
MAQIPNSKDLDISQQPFPGWIQVPPPSESPSCTHDDAPFLLLDVITPDTMRVHAQSMQWQVHRRKSTPHSICGIQARSLSCVTLIRPRGLAVIALLATSNANFTPAATRAESTLRTSSCTPMATPSNQVAAVKATHPEHSCLRQN